MQDFTGLALLVIALSIYRLGDKIMDNNTALTRISTAVTDAVAALRDLASKAAAGQDISAPLSSLADTLEAGVTGAGEPGTLPPA